MPKAEENNYDAIIIGAGIGGLVCGCYLAKAGMKVLICEQHSRPGGYCTSFKRRGFTFDAAAHSFGGYRNGGTMNRILNELDIPAKIQISKYDPADIIVSPDSKFSFYSDLDKTVKEMQTAFPDESVKIRDFLSFLANPSPHNFAALRKKTFKDLLDQYFTNTRLKAMLSVPVLGNGGLPPSLMTAFAGAKIYSEFLLDGGYYPDGGMQSLSDALAERFKEFGGALQLSTSVTRIKLKDNVIRGIIAKNGESILSKHVISNCDARQTYLKLLGKGRISSELLTKINSMIPSLSIFVLYLGIDNFFEGMPKPGSNIWFLPHYDIEGMYVSARNGKTVNLNDYYMIRVSPDGKTILAFVNVAYRNKNYWANNKSRLLDDFTQWIEKNSICDLSSHIVYKEAATPYTMYRYTLNYQGAAYGWAGILSQFADPDFRHPASLRGLYFVGHWTTIAQGIPGVAYSGYDVSRNILKRNKCLAFYNK